MARDDGDNTSEKRKLLRWVWILYIALIACFFGLLLVAALHSLAACLAVVGVVGCLALMIVVSHLWCRWRRRRVFGPREPMSNEQFLEEIGATEEQSGICLAVRESFAVACETEPEKLYPDDRAVWLGNLMPLPLDTMVIRMELEDRLGVVVPYEFLAELLCGRTHPGWRYAIFGSRRFQLQVTVGSFAINFARAIGECEQITGQTNCSS